MISERWTHAGGLRSGLCGRGRQSLPVCTVCSGVVDRSFRPVADVSMVVRCVRRRRIGSQTSGESLNASPGNQVPADRGSSPKPVESTASTAIAKLRVQGERRQDEERSEEYRPC